MTITTLNLISKQTVGAAGAASVTFSNIPQTYTDLKIVISARTDTAGEVAIICIDFNGDTTDANYTTKRLYGSGSGASSDSYLRSGYSIGGGIASSSGATASTFSNSSCYIPNYTGSNKKSLTVDGAAENNDTTAYTFSMAGLWTGTAAITSFTLFPEYGTIFVENSTFYLYGISNNTTTQNASVPYALGGNIITTDGSYWYHAFTSSGTFTPLKSISSNCLIVAGGGGGGSSLGGGGGAGGLRGLTAQSMTATPYAITVGAGGTGSSSNKGATGTNSSVIGGALSLTSDGGGGGGRGNEGATSIGINGGSGGGAGSAIDGVSHAGGTATSGQGNNGGSTTFTLYYGGGGGGGAGAIGSNGAGVNSGLGTGSAGGVGVNTYSSWASATGTGVSGYYAGGGGGGGITDYGSQGGAAIGGTGGGGTGGINGSTAGGYGTANTGSGGGGGGPGGSARGGDGGSGIVIIRYAV